jgi:hypothetical protein
LNKLLAAHQRACLELPKLQETHGDWHEAIVSRCVSVADYSKPLL